MSTANAGRKRTDRKPATKRARRSSVAPTKLSFSGADGTTSGRVRREFLREFRKLDVPERIEVRIGNLLVELPVSQLPELSAVIADRATGAAPSRENEAASSTSKARAAKAGAVEKDLTTQQAATILNVSRPFVAALADKGLLPVKMVGRNRRFGLADVLSYEKKMRKSQHSALQDLADQAQELGLGY